MGEKYSTFTKFLLLGMFLALAANVHADMLGCSAHTIVDKPDQQQAPVNIKIDQVKKNKKTKVNSSYFGMFKLLIPETLR